MEFRRTEVKDISSVVIMYNQAISYLKNQGINQWQSGYPNESTLRKDMADGDSYVIESNGKVIASACISFKEDMNYRYIEGGSWQNNHEYAVIHRIVVDESVKGKGVAKVLMDACEQLCIERAVDTIRIDTHEENKSMQSMIAKQGFVYCGVIFLQDGAPRNAYDKVLVLSTINKGGDSHVEDFR